MSETLVVPASGRPGIDRLWTRADAVYGRGIYSGCQQERSIRNDRMIRAHQLVVDGRQTGPCPGTDHPPVRVTLDPAG